MNRLRNFVLVRHRHNWAQLIRFGLVGGSGVAVNMAVVIGFKRIGPDYHGAFVPVPLTDLHIRWYHVMVTVAFLVANCWNFLINRHWTFGTHRHARWYREYPLFLAVGATGQVVNLGLVTALIAPGSPIVLPGTLLDDSTGLRTKLYWAQLIAIAIVMPLSFVVNKLWTFSAVRRLRSGRAADAGPGHGVGGAGESGSDGALPQPPADSRLQ